MTAPLLRTLQVGQALHGYDGGHALLASSESFSHATESTLFLLSDLSGDQLVPGFEEYITGYPLPELAAYAFAKTWYAAEMERPGCVWTHTLLIRASDLAVISDCSLLLKKFRRPTKSAGDWSKYENKLLVDIQTDYEHSRPSAHVSPEYGDALSAIYTRPDAPVFLLAQSSREYEELVLRLWSQQWPRLRRAFRFCTGSLESRSFEGHPFDLQVVPFSSSITVQRELPGAVFVGKPLEFSNVPEDDTRWLQVAIEDLREPNLELRQFLRDFGADVASKRVSFSRLLRVFDLILEARSNEISFSTLVEKLLSVFPSGSEAVKLKLAVLRPFRGDDEGLQLHVSNQERLLELATLSNEAGLPKRIADLEEWAQFLLSNDETLILKFVQSVITSPRINSVGQQLLDSIAANLRPEQLRSANASPSVSLFLATRNPRLAAYPSTWQLLASRSHELLDLLAACNLMQEDWSRIVRAAVESGVPNLAGAFAKIVRAVAIRAALDWAEEQNSTASLGQDWHEELGNQSAVVAEWIRHHPKPSIQILKDLTSDLNPDDPAILALGSDIWQPVAEVSTTLSTRSNVFLFVLGCQNPAGAPYGLVSAAFDKVHRAAGFEALGYQSWELLRDMLPVLGPSKDWDVCERLRRLLVSRFLAFGWPTSAFVRALETPETLESTLQFVISQRDLRPFARHLTEDIQIGVATLKPAQSMVFERYWKKLRRS